MIQLPAFETLSLDQKAERVWANGVEQETMIDLVKGPLDVSINDPFLSRTRPGEAEDFGNSMVAIVWWQLRTGRNP